MGERYLTTSFTIDNNKWIEDYWKVVQNDWKRQNPSIAVGYKYNYPKVKKIIYNFKNPEKPATIVFWGDGTSTKGVSGSKTITHTFLEAGEYDIVITGVIEDITSFTTNAIVVWNKLL